MVTDDDLSTQNLILVELRKQTSLLEMLVSAQSAGKKRTKITDDLAGKALVLMTRPENRTSKNGKVIKSRIADELGMDVRTLNNMPEFQQAIEAIEGD